MLKKLKASLSMYWKNDWKVIIVIYMLRNAMVAVWYKKEWNITMFLNHK